VNMKIRDGNVANRPIYVALAVTCEGTRDILGLWAGEHGGRGGFWDGHRFVGADSRCCLRFSRLRVFLDFRGWKLVY
jgi:hypothetical protein